MWSLNIDIFHLQICEWFHENRWNGLHIWFFMGFDYDLWYHVNASNDSRSVFLFPRIGFLYIKYFFFWFLFLVVWSIKCVRNVAAQFSNVLVILSNVSLLQCQRICYELFWWDQFLHRMWLVYISSRCSSFSTDSNC